jgi:predicted nucleic acid-binding protein
VTTVAYVDASALVKLALDEPDAAAMRNWYLENERVVCSRVGIIETHRAAGRRGHDPAHLRAILESVEVVELGPASAARAESIGPRGLKTLDAIHLATALSIGAEIDAFVTYDDRLAEAARAVGLPVVRPAR